MLPFKKVLDEVFLQGLPPPKTSADWAVRAKHSHQSGHARSTAPLLFLLSEASLSNWPTPMMESDR